MTTETNNSSTAEIDSSIRIIKHRQSKIEILQDIADDSGLTRKEVQQVFNSLIRQIQGHMTTDGSGEIIIPGTGIKVKRIVKKATKAREIFSPITGKNFFIESKPEHNTIKLIALQTLKELVQS